MSTLSPGLINPEDKSSKKIFILCISELASLSPLSGGLISVQCMEKQKTMELRKMLPLFHVDNSILKVAVPFFLIKNFCISRTIRFIKKTTFHKDIIKVEFIIAHKLTLFIIFTILSSEDVGVTMALLFFPLLHSILLAQNHLNRVPKQKRKMRTFI
uniref:Uncharacterized protein n=1 Tax=Echinococcus canadensis TaxID=519352 RepID=A0A915EYL4_9CEST